MLPQSSAGDRGINYRNEGRITPGVRCLTYQDAVRRLGSSRSTVSSRAGQQQEGCFWTKIAIRQQNSKITGRGLRIGPNKTQSKTQVWGSTSASRKQLSPARLRGFPTRRYPGVPPPNAGAAWALRVQARSGSPGWGRRLSELPGLRLLWAKLPPYSTRRETEAEGKAGSSPAAGRG